MVNYLGLVELLKSVKKLSSRPVSSLIHVAAVAKLVFVLESYLAS